MLREKARDLILEFIMLSKGYIYMEGISDKNGRYYFYCYHRKSDTYSIWCVVNKTIRRVSNSLTDLDLTFKSYGIIYD